MLVDSACCAASSEAHKLLHSVGRRRTPRRATSTRAAAGQRRCQPAACCLLRFGLLSCLCCGLLLRHHLLPLTVRVCICICVCVCICGCANHATVGMQILKQSLKLLRAEGSHFATDCSAWLVLRFGFFSQHAADPRLISGYGHGQVAVLHLGSRIFHLLCLPFSPAKAAASAAQIQLRIFSWFLF